MVNTVFRTQAPSNEPIRGYAPGHPTTEALHTRLEQMAGETVEIPCIVGGEEIFTGQISSTRAPHDHQLELCRWHGATAEVVRKAIEVSQEAWREWSNTPYSTRVAIFEKAAQLLAGRWRDTVNAATMLGQSKSCYQAEIDAACELIDFFRFNNHFATAQVYADQPWNAPGMCNSVDHRPLEGFVYAVSPFNFTSIGANLAAAPVLMGNVALWKPSNAAVYSNYYAMKMLQEAGVPDGVINFIPGDAAAITEIILQSPDFAGLHFTGSTFVFRQLWHNIGASLERYRSYPRIVGETGGKDFIFAHPSADSEALVVAALRGAFEYQGQKCSAASRMYVPRSLWPRVQDHLVSEMRNIKMGDVRDFSNFVAAVIHQGSFDKISGYINAAKNASNARIVQGGECSRDKGWFIQPTLIECDDPRFKTMEEEIFGPVLSVYVYEDSDLEDALELCDTTSPYALTGAVFAQDRVAVEALSKRLRHAAGNFYINDKPTGAVVGQQPFGGARASGTDDKAGSAANLMRWVAPRTIKETYDPPRDWRYPHMG